MKKNLILSAAILCMASLLSSCLKNNSNYYNPPAALVSFFQASPDEPSLDLYFNNNRVNWSPLTFGSSLDYFNAYAGRRTINFYMQNTMTTVYSDTATLKPNQVYSLFLANTTSQPQIVVLNDTINQPAANMASIRFVDMSPDAPAVDFAVNNVVSVSNRSFKGFSSFAPITGNKSYNFEVLQHGTNTVIASLATVGLNSGGVYTIIFAGLASGTTSADKPAIYYVTNAQY